MDWKSLVSTISPWIGAAIGGPLGSVAITAVADALGLSDSTEASIKQALSSATPEQLLALKTADQTFSLRMQELGFANLKDMEALAANDRNSARQREMTVKDNTPKILAYGITFGFFSLLLFMLFNEVPNGSRDLLNILMGALASAWAGVVAYYFGSSSGSSEKTKLLAQASAIKE